MEPQIVLKAQEKHADTLRLGLKVFFFFLKLQASRAATVRVCFTATSPESIKASAHSRHSACLES